MNILQIHGAFTRKTAAIVFIFAVIFVISDMTIEFVSAKTEGSKQGRKAVSVRIGVNQSNGVVQLAQERGLHLKEEVLSKRTEYSRTFSTSISGTYISEFISVVDGSVACPPSAWATCHAASSGSVGESILSGVVMQIITGCANPCTDYRTGRAFLLFDTSLIGTDDVSYATLSLWATATEDSDNDEYDYISIVTTSPASDGELVLDDFDQVGTTEQHDTGERKDITDIITDQYTVWTLNTIGIQNINATGITKFGIREGHDLINSVYGGGDATNNKVNISTSEAQGQEPKLIIIHTTSNTTPSGTIPAISAIPAVPREKGTVSPNNGGGVISATPAVPAVPAMPTISSSK